MGNKNSIHLEDFLNCKEIYSNHSINKKWILIKNIRRVATGAIEKIREEKIIRSSLEAHLDIFIDKETLSKVKDVSFSEIAITSSFKLCIMDQNSDGFSIDEIPNVKVQVSKASGTKCQRCWKYESNLVNEEICSRCNDALSKLK